MTEQIHRTRQEGNDLRHNDDRHMGERLDMKADIGGETMSNLVVYSTYRDRTVIKAAADEHGKPDGPCEAAGELSCDPRRAIIEMRD